MAQQQQQQGLPLGLPRIAALKNGYNSKYMRYTNENTDDQGLLQFTEEKAVSPLAKFHIEAASTTAAEGLVHIRCAYNNKYWRRWDSQRYWIAAAADAPEEDRSKWSCTLFEPVLVVSVAGVPIVRLRHVQLNNYACLFNSPDTSRDKFLYAGWDVPNKDLMDACLVVDRESLVVLPQLVAFKGGDGVYLRPYILNLLCFMSKDKDIGAEGVGK